MCLITHQIQFCVLCANKRQDDADKKIIKTKKKRTHVRTELLTITHIYVMNKIFLVIVVCCLSHVY